MNDKNYELYQNTKFMMALKEAVEETEFEFPENNELPEGFMIGYYDYFEEQLADDPDNEEYKNILEFIDKCYFLFASGEYFIFDYYSEEYKRNFYICWDTEGTCEILNGNCVSLLDNYELKCAVLKPIRLNYIRKCKSLGFIYDKKDFEDHEECEKKEPYERLFSKEKMKNDKLLYSVLRD
jgi:hypothetical protein